VRIVYDWAIATDAPPGHGSAAMGVSDQKQRARERMLMALGAVPAGVTARGWVIYSLYTPSAGRYLRYGFAVHAERDASGAVQVRDVPGID
jgi:hypothetical protein